MYQDFFHSDLMNVGNDIGEFGSVSIGDMLKVNKSIDTLLLQCTDPFLHNISSQDSK